MSISSRSRQTIWVSCWLLMAGFTGGAHPVGIKNKGICYAVVASDAPVTPKGDRIVGRWYFPERESNIKIYRENGHYFARILGVSEATSAKFGTMSNKMLLTDLRFAKNEWSGGQLIHPQTGNRFDVFLTLADDNTLVITAYKGCRLFSKAYTLTRI